MKHLILCFALFAAVLGFSVASVCRVGHIADHTASLLRQAQLLAQQQDPAAAVEAVRKADAYWEEHNAFLCIVLQHDQVDVVTGGLKKLDAYATSQDQDDFFSTCAELLSELSHISQMELPLPQNILCIPTEKRVRLETDWSDCQKTEGAKNYGGKESVKENRQGCLSRSINRFSKLF